jgi:hypothetical protein
MTGMDGQILREKKHDIICDRSPSSVTGLGWMHVEREKKKSEKKKIKCEQRTCTIAQKVIM